MRGKQSLQESFSPYPFQRILKKGIEVFFVLCAPPRVILSGGRSPKSNPAGVCVAQDLRGGEVCRPRSRHYVSRSAFDSLRSLRMTRTSVTPHKIRDRCRLSFASNFIYAMVERIMFAHIAFSCERRGTAAGFPEVSLRAFGVRALAVDE